MEGARKVSRAVEKNRGLTPHRRRDIKNPRVKARHLLGAGVHISVCAALEVRVASLTLC